MKVVDLPVHRVRGTEYNPRTISKEQLAHLAASMKRFGVVDPIVVNRRAGKRWAGAKRGDVVVGGHQRLRLVREAGSKTIPAVIVRLAPDNEKLLNLALNRIGGEFDLQKLAGIFKELRGAKSKLEGTGFDEKQLEIAIHQAQLELESSMEGVVGEDSAPGLSGKVRTHPGDIITLGRHRLMCGDCTNAEHVKALVRGKRSSLLSTDPPYLVGFTGDNKHRPGWHKNKLHKKGKMSHERVMKLPPRANLNARFYKEGKPTPELYMKFLKVAIEHVLVERPTFYEWHAHATYDFVREAWKANGINFHQLLFWLKNRAVISRSHFMWLHEPCAYGFLIGKSPVRRPPRNAASVWSIPQVNNRDYLHPTQKPVELFRRPILWHTAPGEIVYEPFAGSGSQLIAAETTGRICYAMEISPGFCDVIRERYRLLAHAGGERNAHAKRQQAGRTSRRA